MNHIGFLFDGLIVDLEQLGLVEDEFLTAQASDLIVWSEFDRVTRARFFTHPAVDTPQFIDVELLGVLSRDLPMGFLRRRCECS